MTGKGNPSRSRARLRLLFGLFGMLLLHLAATPQATLLSAQDAALPIQRCPYPGVQPRGTLFEPGGVILTAFDPQALWVYDVERGARYPLPETTPCSTNCHLSPDARWITYPDAATSTIYRMRVDGTQRTPVAEEASEVLWWSQEKLLVWTSGRQAYLRDIDEDVREYLPVKAVSSVQPGGYAAVRVEHTGDFFVRSLIDLLIPAPDEQILALLGIDQTYFNASAWSPDGATLAYIAPGLYDPNVQIAGGEIYSIRPGETVPVQWTNLSAAYGAVRVNGLTSTELSWSPDGTRIAFWVIELLGPNPAANTGGAVLHILNATTGEVVAYCGYATTEHTPNPSRIIWSPDGSHVAFGGRVAGNPRGYLLLALNVADGRLTELSAGLHATFGRPNVIAWGLKP